MIFRSSKIDAYESLERISQLFLLIRLPETVSSLTVDETNSKVQKSVLPYNPTDSILLSSNDTSSGDTQEDPDNYWQSTNQQLIAHSSKVETSVTLFIKFDHVPEKRRHFVLLWKLLACSLTTLVFRSHPQHKSISCRNNYQYLRSSHRTLRR